MGLLGLLGFGSKTRQISAADAHAGIEDGSLILIDVRTSKEWSETGVPQGAECKALQSEDFAAFVLALAEQRKGAAIAFFCLSGMRSKKAAKVAHDAGADQLLIVTDGLEAWSKAGLPLERL